MAIDKVSNNDSDSVSKQTTNHQVLTTLLQLQKNARQAESPAAFRFIVVNKTRRLFQYQQAIMWEQTPAGKIKVLQVSGVGDFSRESPYIRWFESLLHELISNKTEKRARVISSDDVNTSLATGWNEWLPGQSLLLSPMGPSDKPLQRGLCFTRTESFPSTELAIINELVESYAYIWTAQISSKTPRHHLFPLSLSWKKRWVHITLAVLVVLMLPVHISVLAPAEIIPVNPIFITSPIDGVIKEFHVIPNQSVTAGQPLFSLDNTVLRNQYEIAVKNLAVARADYNRTVQQSFKDTSSKADLELLSAKVGLRQVELEYTENLLNQIQVTAQQDGIVMFTEVNDWVGKPVVIGEKILTNARPEQTQLQVWIPVDDAISLAPGARVQLFLNSDPTRPLDAGISETSYEPKMNNNGMLAFPVKARFDTSVSKPRLGMKGTAKIYGERVSLFYYLFRRPWSTLRRVTGI